MDKKSPTSPQDIPQTVGNYRLDKTIGQGTYGKVKLGYDIRTNEKVAVKVLEKANIKNEKQIARIQREIRFLKLLSHPHIVKVYDVIETSENIFIMMEYAPGGELFDYIVANKRLKEKEARFFFRQILSAVEYCHKNSVIHRDLKPENLLLDKDKNIKIIDFGFGNTYKTDHFLETFCGSPFYASPEMILGKKYEGPEVDMWSLGVILFALLCGHLPFDDDNLKDLYRKISTANYQMPAHVNPEAQLLIKSLICPNPKKRATLEMVKKNGWLNDGFGECWESYIPQRTIEIKSEDGSGKIVLDEGIVGRMKAFQYGKEEIDEAFREWIEKLENANPIVSTYFLLREMLEREDQKQKEFSKRPSLVESKKRDSSVSSTGSNKNLYAITEDHLTATITTTGNTATTTTASTVTSTTGTITPTANTPNTQKRKSSPLRPIFQKLSLSTHHQPISNSDPSLYSPTLQRPHSAQPSSTNTTSNTQSNTYSQSMGRNSISISSGSSSGNHHSTAYHTQSMGRQISTQTQNTSRNLKSNTESLQSLENSSSNNTNSIRRKSMMSTWKERSKSVQLLFSNLRNQSSRVQPETSQSDKEGVHQRAYTLQ